MKKSIKTVLNFENAVSQGTERIKCRWPVDRTAKKRPQPWNLKHWREGEILTNVFRFKISKTDFNGWNIAFRKKWMAENLIRYIKLSGDSDNFYLWVYQDALEDYIIPETPDSDDK